LFRVIANAVALHIRIKEYQADQKTHHTTLAGYPIPDDLVGTDYAEKQQHFEVCTFFERLISFSDILFK
jgi:hypothetical protein